MKKFFKNLIIIIFVAVLFFASTGFVMAQNTVSKDMMFGGDDTGGALEVNKEMGGLTTSDPRIIIARVINILFGFLGIVAVSLITYAGWKWMSSQGDAGKIDDAKKLLRNAIVGLVIILASFAIVSFVLSAWFSSVGSGGGDEGCIDGSIKGCGSCGERTCNSGSWSSCFDPCGGSGGSDFYVSSTYPLNNSVDIVRNVSIRVSLNKRILDGMSGIDASDFVVEKIGIVDSTSNEITSINSEDITGTVTLGGNNNIINFKANGDCGNGTSECLDAWGRYKVSISEIDSDTTPSLIIEDYDFEFSTNDKIDAGGPNVGITPAQICTQSSSLPDKANVVSSWARDDSGLQSFSFYQREGAGTNLVVHEETGDFGRSYSADYRYETDSIPAGANYTFGVEYLDVGGNPLSAEFSTIVRPGHCCNGVLDSDEDDVDCGGADCMSCVGGPCNMAQPNECGVGGSNCSDSLCSTWFCNCQTSNECICEEKPIIDWITPLGGFCEEDINSPCFKNSDCADGVCDKESPNGKPGNLVTIGGKYFGNTPGQVMFSNNSGGWTAPARLANEVNLECDNTWQKDQVIVEVPASAVNGPVRIVSSVGQEDTTNDVPGFDNDIRGPEIEFIVNNITRPGLCMANPDHGEQGDEIRFLGINLNNTNAYFGSAKNNIEAMDSALVGPTDGIAYVSNIKLGRTSAFAFAEVLGIKVPSNYLNFTKDAEELIGPSINSFEPLGGNTGQYVTVYGQGFGVNKGSSEVWFTKEPIGINMDTSTSKEASYDFPEICSDNLWSDGQVLVKVPEGLGEGNYYVRIMVDGETEIDSSEIIASNNPPVSPTFNFNSGADLLPSLCKIDPKMGGNNSNIILYGEYFGAQSSGRVRFYDNQDQMNSVTWDSTSNPNLIRTKVHEQAVTGPVRVMQNGSAGNGLNFEIGSCLDSLDGEASCGGVVCCGVGSFREGMCASDDLSLNGNGDGVVDINDCYLQLDSSVFEFTFRTSDTVTTCEDAGLTTCGSVCCASGCDTTGAQCSLCDVGQNECGNGTCCNIPCLDLGGGTTECPPSCSGFSLDSCYNNYCPNSPGICSPNSSPLLGNKCDCEAECGGVGNCAYNDPLAPDILLNKCLKANLESCSIDHTATMIRDFSGSNPQEYNYKLECKQYNGENRWHLKTGTCPLASESVFGGSESWAVTGFGECVETNIICNKCDENFDCLEDGDGDYEGICGIDKNICSTNSICISGRCEQESPGFCECCCSISQNYPEGDGNPSCCTPLICGSTCGDGGDFGLCSGCRVDSNEDGSISEVEQNLSNEACNCSGVNGKYCDVEADADNDGDPDGVCRDCSYLSTNSEECSKYSNVCCVDAQNDDFCRGGKGNTGIVLVDNPNLAYCPYYECSQDNACLNLVVNSLEASFVTKESCEVGCSFEPEPIESCSGKGFWECAGDGSCPNSSGICSTGFVEKEGVCGTDYCNNQYSGVCLDDCSYVDNRCKSASKPVCSVFEGITSLFTEEILENVKEPKCVEDINGVFWRAGKIGTRCPNGNWIDIGSPMCVLMQSGNPVNCDLCKVGFKCMQDNVEDSKGTCIVGGEICPDGSTCTLGECVYDDPLPKCECCCRVDNAQEDCCNYWDPLLATFVPLTCEGECGDVSDSSLGKCSGCATAPDPDAACNCEGGFGKFCHVDDNNLAGVCVDCESLDSSESCSKNPETCCYDGIKDKCLSVENRDSIVDGEINYCAYHSCNLDALVCSEITGLEGGNLYKSSEECSASCIPPGANPEGECVSEANVCVTDICTEGYSCFSEELLTDTNCGSCCCEIGSNDCSAINPSLSCSYIDNEESGCYDSDHSTAPNFGLCCGCSSDSQCGNEENIGCSNDSCCYARPNIVSGTETPSEGEIVCRNSQIVVDFDTEMDLATLNNNNVLIVGQHETACPNGTTIVLGNNKDKNKIKIAYYKVTKILKKFALSIIGKKALADPPNSNVYNYCMVGGKVKGEHIASEEKSRVRFMPSKLLDPNRIYYVIIRGDVNLDSINGIKSSKGVGFNGSGYQGGESAHRFNEATFVNSYIWSFKSLDDGGQFDGACTVDHIEITPKNYLFKTSFNNPEDDDFDSINFDSIKDADKLFLAEAKSEKGNILNPIPGVYTWDWTWDGNYIALADSVDTGEGDELLLRIRPSTINGRANMKVSITESGREDFITEPDGAEAYFSVVICDNPWPSQTSPGEWRPWMDVLDGGGSPNTDFELYYCRDRGQDGTYDDLSVLRSPVISGESGDIYKEFYFFREDEVDATEDIAGESLASGDGVELSWEAIAGVSGYYIYYGKNESSYENQVDVLDTTSVQLGKGTAFSDIEFKNDTIYYFTVTGYTDVGVETEIGESVEILVIDTEPPLAPQINEVVREDEEATINWENRSEERPIFFRIFHRAYDNSDYCHGNTNFMSNGELVNINNESLELDPVEKIELAVKKLNDDFGYCFGIAIYDSNGNSSVRTYWADKP